MKILVIGNQGYVGSALVESLKKKHSHDLIGFDCGIYSKNITSDYNPDQFVDKQYLQDVRKFDVRILEGIEVIIYLAAISNDPMGNEYESLTREINYLSCVKIAKEAKKLAKTLKKKKIN